ALSRVALRSRFVDRGFEARCPRPVARPRLRDAVPPWPATPSRLRRGNTPPPTPPPSLAAVPRPPPPAANAGPRTAPPPLRRPAGRPAAPRRGPRGVFAEPRARGPAAAGRAPPRPRRPAAEVRLAEHRGDVAGRQICGGRRQRLDIARNRNGGPSLLQR